MGPGAVSGLSRQAGHLASLLVLNGDESAHVVGTEADIIIKALSRVPSHQALAQITAEPAACHPLQYQAEGVTKGMTGGQQAGAGAICACAACWCREHYMRVQGAQLQTDKHSNRIEAASLQMDQTTCVGQA